MSDYSISRRDFIVGGLSGSTAASLSSAVAGDAQGAAAKVTVSDAASPIALNNPGPGAWARWLDGRAPAINSGMTWGVPWPQGKHKHTVTHFSLREAGGAPITLQSWPLAFWPDGSLKWTAHAMPANAKPSAGPISLEQLKTLIRTIAAADTTK